jgi:peptide/nickel transport system substrate-binding protein
VSKTPLRITALAVALALLLAACGSSSKNSNSNSSNGPTTTVQVPAGGTLTVGAEQEPDCMDWISSCGGSSWGYWMSQVQTVPFAFIAAGNGGDLTQTPGPVLAGEPTVTFDPVETITYKINPKAVWSDNVAITCDDFAYMVDQQQHGTDLYDPTGYTDIDKVTCPDPKTAVVTYKKGKTFASWQLLFSGGAGIFPSHLLKGKDRDAAMKDGYSWSGGPWIAKWNKGDSIVLTPNPNYWGEKPKLEKVVFKVLADTAAEFQAFRSGQVDAIYPQPQIDVVDAISSGLPDANNVYNAKTASLEALWINNAKFPFDTPEVRQAFAYSIDRDAIVKQLFGKLGVDQASQSLNPPVMKDYSDQSAFSTYSLNLDKVTSLMTGAGWAKGSDGIWAKGGKKATFTINSTTNNKRRELTEQVLQQQLKTAGFDMKVANKEAGDLFGEILPSGNYQVGLYAQVLTALTPGLCNVMCSKNIPGPSNDNSGQNWTRTNAPGADAQLETVDTNTDDNARKTAAAQADQSLAKDVAALPMDPLPDIAIWNKKVVGPIGDNAIMGMFWNINQWGLQQ